MRIAALVAILAPLLMPSLRAEGNDVITMEATVNAPMHDVWTAFTTKTGIESWMVAKTDFELKVGAVWHTSYSRTSTLDDDTTIHRQLLAYDPERMLADRTVKPPKGFPFPNAIGKTWTVVYFDALDDAHTRVTFKMFGFGADEEAQKMRDFFGRGNKATLDSLVRHFAQPTH